MLSPEFFESNVTIMEVLHDFHRSPVETADNRLFTKCPCCDGRLHVHTTHVICGNKDCEFRTGTSFDLLAIIAGGYTPAVEAAIRAYPSRFNHLKHADADFVAEQFDQRRELIRFILAAGAKQADMTDINLHQTRSWLRNIGVDVNAQPYSVLVLSRNEFATFVQLLERVSNGRLVPRIPLGRSQPAIVIPLFASPCVVSGCIMFPLRHSDEIRIFHTGHYRFGFTGLLDMHPECVSQHLFTNVLDAFHYNTKCSQIYRDHFATSVSYDPRSALRIWEPEDAVYEFRNDSHALLASAAELAGHVELRVQANEHDLPVSWQRFCLQLVLSRMTDAGGVTPEIRLLLSSLKYNETQFHTLIDELQLAGHLDWAAQIADIRQTQMIHQAGKVMFYRSATGYYAVKGDGARVDISNFVLSFKSNVVFADSATTCHVGTMHFLGREYPITLASEQLNTPSSIEEAARLAEFKMAAQNPGGELPTIHERATVRDLLQYFRQVTSCLPRTEGIDGLGWTKRRSAFLTPWGKITGEEWNPSVTIPNPAYDLWSSFTLGITPIVTDITSDNLPISIADLISQIVGMVGRGHADFFVKPVGFLYTPEANNILRTLFRAIGQAEPYSFSVRDGSNLEVRGLRGFPMLITGATRGQVERSKQPLFALGDTGLSIFTDISTEALDRAARMLPWIIQKAVQWILKTAGNQVKVYNSVNIAAALTREGAAIIRASCGIEWPESQPIYATIERLLNQIHFNSAPQFLAHNLMEQTITVDLTRIVDVDRTDLHLELLREAKTVRVIDNRIEVDAMSMLRLLENFYGQVPLMARTGMPPAASA